MSTKNLMKKELLTYILMAFISLSLASFTFAVEKPNMVIFLADDHGLTESSVYGNSDILTPMMASLAEQGLVFDRAFVASPACGPSRSALFSGLMPARNGAEENHQRPRAKTQIMVRRMQDAGYEVAAFGKVAHLNYGKLIGFDIEKQGRRAAIGGDVKQYLDNRSSKKPLLLIVGDHRPHVPWIKEMAYDPNKLTLPVWFIDTPQTREHWARYLTDITGMDEQMAKVDAMAKAYFKNDDFLFIYTADHGGQWPFAKWNLYDKGINVPFIARWPGHIDIGTRTGAMVSWIDIFPTLLDLVGGHVPEGIDGQSFLPVLLGLADQHRHVVYTTTTADGTKNVYPIRSVRTARFKYVRNIHAEAYHSNHSDILRLDGAGGYWDSWDQAAKIDAKAKAIVDKYYQRPEIEFFDLDKDPDEQVNLASDPEHKQQIIKMSKLLDTWMIKQGDSVRMKRDPMPLSGPTPRALNAQQPIKKNN
ncbi:MAG: arylsulfatase [Porticoccaceae bacterium]|nr:arylsulfatase [Porticoccaceae bacterium]